MQTAAHEVLIANIANGAWGDVVRALSRSGLLLRVAHGAQRSHELTLVDRRRLERRSGMNIRLPTIFSATLFLAMAGLSLWAAMVLTFRDARADPFPAPQGLCAKTR